MGFWRRDAKFGGHQCVIRGDSGTGKTLSAEAIAKDLGLVMYKIDLSAVVSKVHR